MIEEIKKELLKLNIHECDIEDVFEILDRHNNQLDYKSAWNELKSDNSELIEYGNRAVKDCKLYKNRKMQLLEQKYKLGGE